MMVCEIATSTIATSRMVNTRLDHVEGMLDRDQRTVRTRSVHQVNNISNHPHGYPTTMTAATTTTSSAVAMGSSSYTLTTIPNTTFDLLATTTTTTKTTSTEHLSTRTNVGNTHSNSWRTRKSRTMWKIMPKLKRALVLSVYLLSVFYIPRTSCAPMRNMEERMNSHPKWINPCGMGNNPSSHELEGGVSVDPKDLLSQIEWQAQIAFDAAKNFRDEYVQKTFKMEFDQYHQTWKQNHYDWLPTKEQIPKSLSEETPSEHLEVLELNKSLLDTYEYLQMIAVGLEQIVWDQEDQEEEDFLEKFKETEYKLRSLLCEIQVAIMERGLAMRPDVRRDIMTDPYRNMANTTSRYFRDWVIFRDYMNALEYVVDVFRHFKKNL